MLGGPGYPRPHQGGLPGQPVLGPFHLQKISENSFGNFRLGKACSICHKFHLREQREAWPLILRKKYGTGDKNNKYEKLINGTQIFLWEVSIRKTGLPF